MIPARSAVPPVKACTKVIMEPVFKGFVSINPEKLSQMISYEKKESIHQREKYKLF